MDRPEVRRMDATVEAIVKGLVDNPNAVTIDVLEGQTIVVFEVFMDREDIGKVIGKHGRIIQAIRTILEGASAKDKINYVFQVVED